jgi:hypothetical protein
VVQFLDNGSQERDESPERLLILTGREPDLNAGELLDIRRLYDLPTTASAGRVDGRVIAFDPRPSQTILAIVPRTDLSRHCVRQAAKEPRNGSTWDVSILNAAGSVSQQSRQSGHSLLTWAVAFLIRGGSFFQVAR